MKIETYEQVETSNEAEGLAHDAASIELIEKLGLTGQQSLISKETTTVCPYRQMTQDEAFVFKHLCPRVSKPESYNTGPIPLRVLQIIAWAKDNPIFKRLEIWAADSATTKDPVLVGYIQNPTSTWREDAFILARWADELLPVSVLLPDAYKIYIRNRKTRALREKAEAERELSTIAAIENEVHVPENFSL